MGEILGAVAPPVISIAGGWLGRKLGKSKKVGGDRPVNRVTAPLGAAIAPAGAAALGLDISAFCALLTDLCANPAAAAGMLGVVMAYLHNLLKGAGSAAAPRG